MSKKLMINLNTSINEPLIPGDNILHTFLGFIDLPGNGNFCYGVPLNLTTLCKFKIMANGTIRLKTFYRTNNDIGGDTSRGIRQIVYINDVETRVTNIANGKGTCVNTDIQIKENDIIEIKYKSLESKNGHRVGTYVAICCGNNINSIIVNQ